MQSELFKEVLEEIDTPLGWQLEDHEGFSAGIYPDSLGNPTVGFGTNLAAGISKEEARLLLLYRLEQSYAEMQDFMTPKVISNFEFWTQPRHDAVMNMAYNLGVPRLKKFVKMFAALDAYDAEKAAAEMLDSVWADQVGYRAKELAEQMRTGEYPEKYAERLND